MEETLAILGGNPAVQTDPGDIFKWPIITSEDEGVALEVLRDGTMSGTEVTKQFEQEFADWHGVEFALAHNNGTAALHCAMYGVGIGIGDEIICQSLTYWASALPAMNLGATIVFADINPYSLTVEPEDVRQKITDRTKAIVVVHHFGYPADMDPIMDMANRRGIKVIEDVSHAHGGLYKGRLVGTIGHVGAMSLMSGKALAIGEGGFLITNQQEIHERAVAFGHYERTFPHHGIVQNEDLMQFAGMPLGGFKYRMHQISSAVGRVQLKYYRKRMEEIQKAMNYFWDLLEGVPGLRAHRPPKETGSTMGGWYSARGLFESHEMGGLNVKEFCRAVTAEGFPTVPKVNPPMHLHPLLNSADIYGSGKPTRIVNSNDDVREQANSLPVSESLAERVYTIPWFKHYRPKVIEEHAFAFRKVAENVKQLLA